MMRNAGYTKASANLDNSDVVTPVYLVIIKKFKLNQVNEVRHAIFQLKYGPKDAI